MLEPVASLDPSRLRCSRRITPSELTRGDGAPRGKTKSRESQLVHPQVSRLQGGMLKIIVHLLAGDELGPEVAPCLCSARNLNLCMAPALTLELPRPGPKCACTWPLAKGRFPGQVRCGNLGFLLPSLGVVLTIDEVGHIGHKPRTQDPSAAAKLAGSGAWPALQVQETGSSFPSSHC